MRSLPQPCCSPARALTQGGRMSCAHPRHGGALDGPAARRATHPHLWRLHRIQQLLGYAAGEGRVALQPQPQQRVRGAATAGAQGAPGGRDAARQLVGGQDQGLQVLQGGPLDGDGAAQPARRAGRAVCILGWGVGGSRGEGGGEGEQQHSPAA